MLPQKGWILQTLGIFHGELLFGLTILRKRGKKRDTGSSKKFLVKLGKIRAAAEQKALFFKGNAYFGKSENRHLKKKLFGYFFEGFLKFDKKVTFAQHFGLTGKGRATNTGSSGGYDSRIAFFPGQSQISRKDILFFAFAGREQAQQKTL